MQARAARDIDAAQILAAMQTERKYMHKLNHVVIIGNMAMDVKTRETTGGVCASMLLAVNRPAKVNGSWTEEADFIPVVAWGKTAEACGRYLRKGDNVLIEGRISGRSYQAKTGEKRLNVQIVATSIQFPQRGKPEGFGGWNATQGNTAAAQGQAAAPAQLSAQDADADMPF